MVNRLDDSPEHRMIVEEHVIPAKGKLALKVKRGEVIRVVDLEGQQVMDLVCFNLSWPQETLWVANTAKLNKTLFLTTGHVLYSDRANKMLTIIGDTVGVHDLLCGSCCAEIDRVRYQVENHFGCMENLTEVLAPLGIARQDIPMSFNIFMNAPLKDGSLEIDEPVSKPGDWIDLQAEMDLLVGMSNCPQDMNPCNAWNPTPLKVIVYGDRD